MSEKLAIEGGNPVRTLPFGESHFFGDEDIEALSEVVRSGSLGKGPKVAQFEREFAARHGVAHVVTVTSGTAAMHTCVGAINPDPGDEIIVTPWTSGGSIIGSLLHNCVPVFADVDDTFTLDPADVEAKITPRTRAIIAVHLFGNPCDMTALRAIADRHQLFLIEDCCQAHFAEFQGRVVGSMGDINGFSFGGKHLSAGGGGAVMTDNETLWERGLIFSDCALPRNGGPFEGRPYANYFLAPNYKLNDLMASVLLTQLNKVDGYIQKKIWAAQQIIEQVSNIDEITPQRVREGDRNSYWVMGMTLDTDKTECDAWEFAQALNHEGIPAGGPYIGSGKEGPLYRNQFLSEPNCYGRSRFPFDYKREKPLDYRQIECPNGEKLMRRGFSLAMLPSFDDEDVADISAAIRKVFGRYRKRNCRGV
ncbi:MAG: DegT/DnrJ/EryC1/StrS family aminotransferase [Caldilineaceae bacterium]|nr:DegT/DnrJ/EryC1/StrS family aminotransferase [Caldilineaceae bacterium]MDE0428539.1 DegT/DnrJ/EryC1/StrS family aminotransferase [Caldilineaceae bacterium]